ncbi:hypothetical protein BDR05DRAFT_944765 [Suillus weaverae]|nr:hypothetical protein BDR05DRAFT_944765 [Suillus weaverae]
MKKPRLLIEHKRSMSLDPWAGGLTVQVRDRSQDGCSFVYIRPCTKLLYRKISLGHAEIVHEELTVLQSLWKALNTGTNDTSAITILRLPVLFWLVHWIQYTPEAKTGSLAGNWLKIPRDRSPMVSTTNERVREQLRHYGQLERGAVQTNCRPFGRSNDTCKELDAER